MMASFFGFTQNVRNEGFYVVNLVNRGGFCPGHAGGQATFGLDVSGCHHGLQSGFLQGEHGLHAQNAILIKLCNFASSAASISPRKSSLIFHVADTRFVAFQEQQCLQEVCSPLPTRQFPPKISKISA